MALHLVRHAEAGARPAWQQPDELRPLTPIGAVQAERLADILSDLPLERVLSSRYVRCTETVQPLAERLALPVEDHPALSEEADIEQAWELLEELAGVEAVVCSHGNVIGALLDRLHRRGVELVAADWSCQKGSVWTLEVGAHGRFDQCRLLVEKA